MISQPDETSSLSEPNNSQQTSWIELLRAASSRLYGFDFFISYAWKDGRLYAENLRDVLGAKPYHYRCFLDSKEMGGGAAWRRAVHRALARSKVFILIASEHGLKRDAVFEEVQEFSR